MFDKLSNSWELAKASFKVLQADKELVVFPLISFAALIVTVVIFFAPLAFFGIGAETSEAMEIVLYVAVFLFYLVSTFIMVFFNSALVGAALIRLEGGDPTVADGFRIARQRLGAIFGWSLLAATVGMLLKAIRERSGALGRFIIGLIGIAWNLATFLVVPVLVTRNLGPIDALKESASLLKKTWGEQVVGNFGLGAVFGIAFVLYSVVAVALVALSAASGSAWVIGIAVVVAVLGFGVLALLSTTLNGIYSAALYRYATTGEATFVDQRLLAGAFRPK